MAESATDPAQQLAEGVAIIEDCVAEGASVRLIGGAAIALHSDRGETPHRSFSDLDLVASRKSTKALTGVLERRGFEGERQFNAINGDRRLVFHGPSGKLDVFVDHFEMCHEIPLLRRIELDSPTATVTDLLLTKLQVVELNEKDIRDITLLLGAHDCREGEGDWINVDYLGRLLGNDWGLWRTVTGSLDTVAATEPAVGKQAKSIREAVDAAPRTRRFRMRARVGERKRWYELPEEVDE